jgi:CMP-N,N'-diacetyllegionaminic acid synthase
MQKIIKNLEKCFCIIPARSGSKGLVGKNLKKLGGRELFQWSVDAANFLNIEYAVSTDDKKIIELCKKRGILYIKRPSDLCRDHSTDYDFLNHAITHLDLVSKNKSIILNLRPTSPLRLKSDLLELSKILKKTNYSIRSVVESDFPVQKMWYIDGSYLECVDPSVKGLEGYNMPRQLLKKSYKQTGAFDAYMIKDVLSKSINGEKILSFIQKSPIADIDSMKDFSAAENILENSIKDFA